MLTSLEKQKSDPVGIAMKLAILTDGQRSQLHDSLIETLGRNWTLSESFIERLIHHPDEEQISALPYTVRAFMWQKCSDMLSGIPQLRKKSQ